MDTQRNIEPNANVEYISSETNNQMNMFQSQNMIIGLLVILLVLSFLGINILLVIGNFFQAIINIFGPLVYQILGAFGYTAGAVLNKTADVVSDTTKVGIDIAEGTVQSVGNLLIKSSGAVVDPNAKRLLDNAVDTPLRVKIPTPPPVFIPVPVPVPVEVKVPVYSPGSSNSSISFNSLLNNPITRFLVYDPSKNISPTTASPVTASPVTASPVTASPVTASPVTASPVTASPVTASPVTASPTESAAKIQNPISSNKISWCFTGEYQGKRGCVDVEDQSKCLSGQVFPSQQACLSTFSSSDPLISKPIIPTMSANVSNYGNGTMMMNGLPAPPRPPNRPTIEELQTMNPSIVSQKPTIENSPIISQQPTITSAPTLSQRPTITGAPTLSRRPNMTDAPTVLQRPTMTDAPTVLQQPTKTNLTAFSQQSSIASSPVTSQQPAMTAGVPLITQQPAMTAGVPLITQQPTMKTGASTISQQSSTATTPMLSQQSATATASMFSQQPTAKGGPFLPYVPPQTNQSLITADGPPLVNGPINYFYTYSDKLGTEKN